MAAHFTPRANTIYRLVFVGGLLSPFLLVTALIIYMRSPLSVEQMHPISQPLQFDHRHHAGDDGIDCRYCHQTVETSSTAGMPAVSVCLNCHSQIWNKAPILAPVREAYFKNLPIPWQRVNNLPDYVFFNHSIHVNKGVGCVYCHGRVDLMPAVEKVPPFTMQWCLDCHRDPSRHIRPLDKVTSMDWNPPNAELGRKLMLEYDVQPRTTCYTCHR